MTRDQCFLLMNRVLLRESVMVNGEINRKSHGTIQYTDTESEKSCDFFMLKGGRVSVGMIEYIYNSGIYDVVDMQPDIERELRETIGLSCEFFGM